MRSYLFAATALATGLFIGSQVELNIPQIEVSIVAAETDMQQPVAKHDAGIEDSKISSLAPTHSLRPKSRPTPDTASTPEVPGVVLAQVEMVNHNAIRNLPITERLKENISQAVGAVYGPGFRVQVYSGGQHDHETATRLKVPRVGTKAHDHGHAADIHVFGPQGQQVVGDALAPLAQYWLATGKGGVGLEMRGGGIHLDEGRVRFWDYANDGGSVTKVQLTALISGKRGVMPELHSVTFADHDFAPDEQKAKIHQLQNYIQQFESSGAVTSQGVQSAYQVVYGGIAAADRPAVPLTSMTVAEVLDWQDSIDAHYRSEAAGAYQVMEDTLRGLVDSGQIDRNAVFNEATQDYVAELLMERRGLSKFVVGAISAEDFADNLAREWASFPVVHDQQGANRYVERGQSYYAGDGLNKAHADADEFLSVVKGIIAASAELPEAATTAAVQREAPASETKKGTVTLGVKKSVDGPITINGQLGLVEYRDWNITTNAEYGSETDTYNIGGTATYEKDNLLFSFSGAHDSDDNTEFSAEVKYHF